MAFFAKHSDREYDALAKKLAAAEGKLAAAEALERELSEKLRLSEAALSEQKTAAKKAADQIKGLEKAQSEQKEENDLLLAQLHQVQEELEKYFLENKAQQDKAGSLEKELKTQQDKAGSLEKELKTQQDFAAKTSAEAKKLVEQLAASNKQVADVQAAAQKSVEDIKAKLVETEKKLNEANKLIKAEGDAKVNEVQKQKADLEKKLAAANDAATKATAELDALQTKLTAANDAAAKAQAERENLAASESDLKSENDLLLAQLHQVQEELEKYYLSNKDLEAALTESAELIKRTRYALVGHLKWPAKQAVAPKPVAPPKALASPKAPATKMPKKPTGKSKKTAVKPSRSPKRSS